MTRLSAVLLCAVTVSFASFAKIPYLQNQTDSSIVVHWETSASATGKVLYGLTTSYGQEVDQSGSATDHELTLPGLLTDTVYHYRAISGSDTSADASFHSDFTGDRHFRFFAYGDDRSDSASHASVVNRMLQQSPMPELALNVGDLTYDGSTPVFTTFFNVSKGLISRMPLYPALGNHDVSNTANWFKYFALPNNERWYAVHFGNSAFICLDVYSTYTPGSTEYNWFLSELQADSANPAVKHIFVFYHEPPYTTNTGHTSNLTIQQYLCPLFVRFHVAMTFMGHNHCYEHALVSGVHYFLTGGGGAPLYTSWDAAQPWDVYREATFEFVLVDVNGDTIKTVGIRPAGTRFDSLLIVPTGISQEPGRKPVAPVTLSALPSPAVGRVRLTFTLPEAGQATLALYDPTGRRAATLASGSFAAGEHSVSWNTAGLDAGTYILVLKSAAGVSVRHLVNVGR